MINKYLLLAFLILIAAPFFGQNEALRFDGLYVCDNGIDTIIKNREMFLDVLKLGIFDDSRFDEKQLDTMYFAMPGSRRLEYIKFYKKNKTVIITISEHEIDVEQAWKTIKFQRNKKIKKEGDFYDYYLSDNHVTFYFGALPKYISYIGKIEKDSIAFKLSLLDIGSYPYPDSLKVFKFYPFKK